MTIRITPESIAGPSLANFVGQRYRCPGCNSQTVEDHADIGWVCCPIARDRYICLGCCLDIAGACSSDDFDAHFYKKEVEELASLGDMTTNEARLTCLRHQLEMLPEQERNGVRYAVPSRAIEAWLTKRLREAEGSAQ